MTQLESARSGLLTPEVVTAAAREAAESGLLKTGSVPLV